MKASILRNEFGNIGLFYGEDLGFAPEWAAIDVERGELSVYDNNDQFKLIFMEGMDDAIYKQILREQRIFLVEVKDNDVNKPQRAVWVNLMVTQQI